jgi:hypothetical protein
MSTIRIKQTSFFFPLYCACICSGQWKQSDNKTVHTYARNATLSEDVIKSTKDGCLRNCCSQSALSRHLQWPREGGRVECSWQLMRMSWELSFNSTSMWPSVHDNVRKKINFGLTTSTCCCVGGRVLTVPGLYLLGCIGEDINYMDAKKINSINLLERFYGVNRKFLRTLFHRLSCLTLSVQLLIHGITLEVQPDCLWLFQTPVISIGRYGIGLFHTRISR